MSNFFVRFLEELRIPKSPFEINWPLEISFYKGYPVPDVKLENQLRFMARWVVINTAVIHTF